LVSVVKYSCCSFKGGKNETCRVLKDLGNLRLCVEPKQEACAQVSWLKEKCPDQRDELSGNPPQSHC